MSKSNFTANALLGVAAPTAGRIISNLDVVEQWMRIVSLGVGVSVGAVSFAIASIQLIRIVREKIARRQKTRPPVLPLLAIAGILIFGSGCTFARKTTARITGQLAGVESRVQEESKALTTAGVDTLSQAPTNEWTALALELARKDQLLEGLPKERIDVAGVLNGDEVAVRALAERYRIQAQLIQEKAAVEAKLRETESRLIEMGKKYEEEKNRSIWKRIWRWSLGTLGLGGMIALCVFCPVVIPIFARAAAWIVSLFPKLAGAIGVVSTNAFDAVVKGVEAGKKASAAKADPTVLETELSKAMDAAHKQLVRARKPIVTQPAF